MSIESRITKVEKSLGDPIAVESDHALWLLSVRELHRLSGIVRKLTEGDEVTAKEKELAFALSAKAHFDADRPALNEKIRQLEAVVSQIDPLRETFISSPPPAEHRARLDCILAQLPELPHDDRYEPDRGKMTPAQAEDVRFLEEWLRHTGIGEI